MKINELKFQRNSKRINTRNDNLKSNLDIYEPDDEYDLCIYDFVACLLKTQETNKTYNDNDFKAISIKLRYAKLLAYMLAGTEEDYFIILVKNLKEMIKNGHFINSTLSDINLLLELFECNEEILEIKAKMINHSVLSDEESEEYLRRLNKLSKKVQKLRNTIAYELFQNCSYILKEHPQLKYINNIQFNLSDRPLKITGYPLNLDFVEFSLEETKDAKVKK